jgi:hypothetical protein
MISAGLKDFSLEPTTVRTFLRVSPPRRPLGVRRVCYRKRLLNKLAFKLKALKVLANSCLHRP